MWCWIGNLWLGWPLSTGIGMRVGCNYDPERGAELGSTQMDSRLMKVWNSPAIYSLCAEMSDGGFCSTIWRRDRGNNSAIYAIY